MSSYPSATSVTISVEDYLLVYGAASEAGDAASQLHGKLLNGIISTAMYGAFAICAIVSTYVLLRKGRKPLHTATLLFVTAIMCSCTTLYWVLGNHDILRDMSAFDTYYYNVVKTSYCLQDSAAIGGSVACPSRESVTGIADIPDPWSQSTSRLCVGAAAFTINNILGNTIISWRATVVWYGNKTVRFICALLLLATYAMGVVSTVHSCSTRAVSATEWKDPPFETALVFRGDSFGMMVVISCVNIATNLTAASLIIYKAWTRRHQTLERKQLRSHFGRSRIEDIMSFLVESGLVYCIIWVVILGYQTTTRLGYRRSNLSQAPAMNSVSSLDILTEAAVTMIIAINATLIIIIVALDKSRCTSRVLSDTWKGNQSIIFVDPRSRITDAAATATMHASSTLLSPGDPWLSAESTVPFQHSGDEP